MNKSIFVNRELKGRLLDYLDPYTLEPIVCEEFYSPMSAKVIQSIEHNPVVTEIEERVINLERKLKQKEQKEFTVKLFKVILRKIEYFQSEEGKRKEFSESEMSYFDWFKLNIMLRR